MSKCSVTETVGERSPLDSAILVEEAVLLLQTRQIQDQSRSANLLRGKECGSCVHEAEVDQK